MTGPPFPPDLPTLPAVPEIAAAQAPARATRGLWQQFASAIGRSRAPAGAAHDAQAAGRALATCLADLPSERTQPLCQLLAHARSATELRHLRPEVYRLLALHHSQDEAERRLGALDPGFDASLRRVRPGSELPA